MKNAIYELKSIASHANPMIEKEISKWIDRHISEAHWEIKAYYPSDEEHREHQIAQARHELGKHLAENSNMYPTFEKIGIEMICRISTLYFKNEFGK